MSRHDRRAAAALARLGANPPNRIALEWKVEDDGRCSFRLRALNGSTGPVVTFPNDPNAIRAGLVAHGFELGIVQEALDAMAADPKGDR